MDSEISRSKPLYGEEGYKNIKNAHVIIFGIGGVGGYVSEALTRAGIGRLTFVDGDTVCVSNLNRQLIALSDTVGQYKAKLMEIRAKNIMPEAQIQSFSVYYNDETKEQFDVSQYTYVVDCVDDVAAKLMLAEQCAKKNIPLISSMGTAMRMDPTRFQVGDIMKTSVCPLARVMRRELKCRGIRHLKCVWSDEVPKMSVPRGEPLPSVSFVPAAAGMVIAGAVISDIINMT